jgi:hypothetical protein
MFRFAANSCRPRKLCERLTRIALGQKQHPPGLLDFRTNGFYSAASLPLQIVCITNKDSYTVVVPSVTYAIHPREIEALRQLVSN